jgi:hypothetical protein
VLVGAVEVHALVGPFGRLKLHSSSEPSARPKRKVPKRLVERSKLSGRVNVPPGSIWACAGERTRHSSKRVPACGGREISWVEMLELVIWVESAAICSAPPP